MGRGTEAYAGARAAQASRKTMQLCKQVERVLSSVLPECREERVHELSLLGVEPACGVSVLRVALLARTGSGEELEAIREALERAKPFVRTQVAQAISRKRAPELVFALVPS